MTLRLKRRLCSHKACAGLHVKCASCLSDVSHSRTVSADINRIPQCQLSVTRVLVMGVELSLADRRTDMTGTIVTSRICFLNAPKCAFARKMWAFLCGSFGHQNKQWRFLLVSVFVIVFCRVGSDS